VTVKEEKEKILNYAQEVEEEHLSNMLTPWEEELEMLEDWLNNPEPERDYHKETIMQVEEKS